MCSFVSSSFYLFTWKLTMRVRKGFSRKAWWCHAHTWVCCFLHPGHIPNTAACVSSGCCAKTQGHIETPWESKTDSVKNVGVAASALCFYNRKWVYGDKIAPNRVSLIDLAPTGQRQPSYVLFFYVLRCTSNTSSESDKHLSFSHRLPAEKHIREKSNKFPRH